MWGGGGCVIRERGRVKGWGGGGPRFPAINFIKKRPVTCFLVCQEFFEICSDSDGRVTAPDARDR